LISMKFLALNLIVALSLNTRSGFALRGKNEDTLDKHASSLKEVLESSPYTLEELLGEIDSPRKLFQHGPDIVLMDAENSMDSGARPSMNEKDVQPYYSTSAARAKSNIQGREESQVKEVLFGSTVPEVILQTAKANIEAAEKLGVKDIRLDPKMQDVILTREMNNIKAAEKLGVTKIPQDPKVREVILQTEMAMDAEGSKKMRLREAKNAAMKSRYRTAKTKDDFADFLVHTKPSIVSDYDMQALARDNADYRIQEIMKIIDSAVLNEELILEEKGQQMKEKIVFINEVLEKDQTLTEEERIKILWEVPKKLWLHNDNF